MGHIIYSDSTALPRKHWWSRTFYETTGPLIYEDKFGRIWKIPYPIPNTNRGFFHNFASTPRIVWPLGLTPRGPWEKAAVYHDKFHDDKLFLEIMLADGVPMWLARAMFSVVAHPPKDEDDITAPPEDESIIGG